MILGAITNDFRNAPQFVLQARMTRNPNLEGLRRCQNLPPGSGLLFGLAALALRGGTGAVELVECPLFERPNGSIIIAAAELVCTSAPENWQRDSLEF
jgi:hypothetical protein